MCRIARCAAEGVEGQLPLGVGEGLLQLLLQVSWSIGPGLDVEVGGPLLRTNIRRRPGRLGGRRLGPLWPRMVGRSVVVIGLGLGETPLEGGAHRG